MQLFDGQMLSLWPSKVAAPLLDQVHVAEPAKVRSGPSRRQHLFDKRTKKDLPATQRQSNQSQKHLPAKTSPADVMRLNSESSLVHDFVAFAAGSVERYLLTPV